jgi:hypothetical protein
VKTVYFPGHKVLLVREIVNFTNVTAGGCASENEGRRAIQRGELSQARNSRVDC